jgi:UV DNA damage repair endonuclease
MTIKRIGFACKWIDRPDQVNGIKPTDDCKKYNTGTTTISWLNRQTKDVAEQKLCDLMVQNIEATRKLVEKVGGLDEYLRMVRLSSDLLPAYTHDDFKYFWRRTDVKKYCETEFARIGEVARSTSTRLSFHPGQFTVLASESDAIIQRSIEEFEYHADMARYMGYGRTFQDFKINVHISGKRGPQGIRKVYGQLSPEARNCITIENEENSWGLNDCLSLRDIVPIVLDIHHHWTREGEYIDVNGDSVKQVIDSWRGVRPTLHYSVSREDYLVGHDRSTMPSYASLLVEGYKKQKLRAHSDFYWNGAVNDWAVEFINSHDIMCESKAKNLASFELAKLAQSKGLI